MADDYIYTINQAALIVNKSDKTIRRYMTEEMLDTTKRIEEVTGFEKVFISASSLANLAERKKLSLNFAALEEYTPDRTLLERSFSRPGYLQERRTEEVPTSSSIPLNVPSEVVIILKEQLGKLEMEKEELKENLREKDRQLEEKNTALLQATRESSNEYRLIALAKEQAQSSLAKLIEHTRILHLSTNRDILRLRDGKLQASDISLLPLPSEVQEGDYEPEPPRPDYKPPSPAKTESVIDVSPEADRPSDASPLQEEDAGTASSLQEQEIVPTTSEPEKTERAKIRKQEKQAAKKKPEKKEPEKPVKRGFFRRLFG